MVITIGQQAPDFSLKSHTGELVTLAEFQGKTNVILAFFPLAWTSV